MEVFNNSDGHSFINTTANLKDTFSKVKMFLTIKLRPENAKTFDFVLLDTYANICNIQKGTIGSFLIRIMMEQLVKYSNFKPECPQRAGFYYSYNFPVRVVSDYFPRSILGAIAKDKPLWEVVCRAKVKVSDTKPLVEIIRWKTYGIIKF
jgi:Protein of unknown function (DUF1091)